MQNMLHVSIRYRSNKLMRYMYHRHSLNNRRTPFITDVSKRNNTWQTQQQQQQRITETPYVIVVLFFSFDQSIKYTFVPGRFSNKTKQQIREMSVLCAAVNT